MAEDIFIKNPYITPGAKFVPGVYTGYKVVAVIYDVGWAAYRGLLHWTNEQVRDEGDKIPLAAAKILFPTIADMIDLYCD
jgi:hypothetical protein